MSDFQPRYQDNEFKQQQREAVMLNWKESEWVLDCLRTKTSAEVKHYSDEEIVAWGEQQ